MASSVCWNNLPSVVLLEVFKMISHEERIKASSTCKEWRKALFFPNFWRDLSINLYSENDKYAIERCQFFTSSFISSLRNIKIIFNYENNYLSQVSKVLSELSGNRQVKKLSLYSFEEPSNLNLIVSLNGCATNLINFLENVKSINLIHISHVWFSLKNNNFRLALEKQKESLRSLGIGAVFDSDQQNQELNLPVDFSVFKHLTVLSLDHVWVTDEPLKQICDLKLLKRLIVLLNKEFKGKRAKNESWEFFHKSLPECELRINLIKGVTKDIMKIFSKRMPVTHIKVLYCDEIDLSLMSIFSSFKDLKSVWCLAEDDLETLLLEQNPLVICAWTCRKLEELVIIGFQFDYEDLIGIARLRGSKLRKLEISRTDIVKLFDVDNTQNWDSRNLFPIEMNLFTEQIFKEEIKNRHIALKCYPRTNIIIRHQIILQMMSKALNRNWSPVDSAAYKQSNLSPYENKINNIVETLSKDYEI